jgi:hypothetical protein
VCRLLRLIHHLHFLPLLGRIRESHYNLYTERYMYICKDIRGLPLMGAAKRAYSVRPASRVGEDRDLCTLRSRPPPPPQLRSFTGGLRQASCTWGEGGPLF